MRIGRSLRFALAAVTAMGCWSAALAVAAELNLYSSRHYQTDEALYETFTRQTGITINRIEGKEDELIERIRNEGRNSPADILITVDAGRLWRADQAGLFQPVRTPTLESRIPANLRHPDGHWFGFSQRARVIIYNKANVDPAFLRRYEDLADPRWKGLVCIRSGSNIYNLSLMSALIAELGEPAAEAWAKGVVANFARPPQGGDTDQIKAVAAGECGVGLVNTYYVMRLLRSAKPEERAVAEKVGVVFPNQADRGTHVNISGAGVLKNAPNRDAAIRFLEYLAGDEAQRYFADGNNEYPAVSGITINEALVSLGTFKVDPITVAVYGENQPRAQMVFDRAGWK
jgi:iron(III) transport system substrate-binding protein